MKKKSLIIRFLRGIVSVVMLVMLLAAMALWIVWPITSFYRMVSVTGGVAWPEQLDRIGWSAEHELDIVAALESSGLLLMAWTSSSESPTWFEVNTAKPTSAWDNPGWRLRLDRSLGLEVILPIPVVAAALQLLPVIWFVWLAWRDKRLIHLERSNVCLHCGHNLRDTVGDTCPECGKPRAMVTVP